MPTGSCLCHKLAYEYTGEPLKKATCHCLSCRKLSGGTNSVNLLIPSSNIRITTGTAKSYTEDHESGHKLTTHFCGDCGCTIYKTHESFKDSVIVLAGTLDGPEELEKCRPDAELFAKKHRVSWLPCVEGAVQEEGL